MNDINELGPIPGRGSGGPHERGTRPHNRRVEQGGREMSGTERTAGGCGMSERCQKLKNGAA